MQSSGDSTKTATKDELPLVLVGMPVLNRATKLPKTLEAITNLDYPKQRISFLFVDGDSADQSFKILENFKEEYSKVYRNIQLVRGGYRSLPKSRNRVFKEITQEQFVFFIDSDVIVNPDTLNRLLDLASRGFDLTMLYQSDDPNEGKKSIYEVDSLGMGCTLISTAAIRTVGPFDERLAARLPEDIEWCLRARKHNIRMLVDGEHRVRHQMFERPQLYRWSPGKRSFTAFLVWKLFAFGRFSVVEGTEWIGRLGIYFAIFACFMLATILVFIPRYSYFAAIFYLPWLAFLVAQTVKRKSILEGLKRSVDILILFPVVLYGLVELFLILNFKFFLRLRNNRILGVSD